MDKNMVMENLINVLKDVHRFNIGYGKQFEEYLKKLWNRHAEAMISLGICKVEIK